MLETVLALGPGNNMQYRRPNYLIFMHLYSKIYRFNVYLNIGKESEHSTSPGLHPMLQHHVHNRYTVKPVHCFVHYREVSTIES